MCTFVVALLKDIGFVVEHINISGAGDKTEKLIEKHIDISRGDSILKVSACEIYSNIMKINWIKTAIVQKNLPNIINIKVEERMPIAVFQHDNKSTLIDREGFFIEDIKYRSINAPIIAGDNGNIKGKEIIDTISKFSIIREKLESLTFIRERRWDIVVAGIKIKLPEFETDEALEILSSLISTGRITKETVSALDFRIQNEIILVGLKLKRNLSI
jgi:cell division protein FtsQ